MQGCSEEGPLEQAHSRKEYLPFPELEEDFRRDTPPQFL